MRMKRREFLAAGLALNLGSTAMALAQQGGAAPAGAGGQAARRHAEPSRRRRPGCSNRRACIPTRWR